VDSTADPVTIRAYSEMDFDGVTALWTRINRELAPANMRELFEQYIAAAVNGELRHLLDIFSEAKRNAFWVVETGNQVVGSFGIESKSKDTTELRRMYLDQGFRGRGIAQRMLGCAQSRARELGFSKMILSAAEVQDAAISFYTRSGFQFVKSEIATVMTTASVGGGLARFHFEKLL
jgi:GNAT superfamily N-acetyltransferase